MTWFLDMDHFSISKSVVVADIDNLIAAILGIQGPATAEALAQITPGLHHPMQDFEGQEMNPYEADAVEMAIRTGHLAEHYAKIIHSGPGTQGYEQAVQEALMIGRPMVNHAAQEQNRLNQDKFNPAPVPFRADGSLDPAYQQTVVSSLAKQTGIRGRGRSDTSFNPFDPETGQVVTHLVSGYSHGNIEGYSRWYEPAAKQLGYIEKKWNKKTGKELGQRRWLIPAHYVHRNLISINDRNMLSRVGEMVKGFQEQGYTHEQIKQGVLDDPLIYHYTHQSQHDPSSTHGRNGRKAGEAQMIRETPPEGVEDQITGPDGSIIHPNMRESNFWQWLTAPKGAVGGQREYSNPKLNGGISQALQQHHGWTPEEVKMVFDRARPTKANGGTMPGRNVRERILASIYHHEMRDGVAPQWYQGQHFEHIPQQPAAQPTAPPPTIAQPPVSAPPTSVYAPPAPVSAPPAPVSAPLPPDPRQMTTPSQERLFGITSNSPPASARSVIPRGKGEQTRMSRLAELLGRLSASDIFHRSDEYRPVIEEYIEDVQMELAKAVIEDKLPIKKMEVESPYDVAILSSQIQKPSSAVIAIYHTRGDWRNIAKTFGVPHDSVQLVKVSLHG